MTRSKQNTGECSHNSAEPKRLRNKRLAAGTETEIVNGLIDRFTDKPKDGISVSDLIRLLQYRRELKRETNVKEIEVRWVEPSATEDVSST